ncbi:MAG: ribosome small subunit-dependent GTPase A [Planctomycetes bacterium]|nr:ribosome small subunit-dependent GTPase A [Planctomycetota bacterium]
MKLSPSLGWDAALAAAFAPFELRGFVPARIVEPRRDGFVAATEAGEIVARLPGSSFHGDHPPQDFPVAGDFAALELPLGGGAWVRGLLPRRTVLGRRSSGRAARLVHRTVDIETIASNLDSVLVLTSLNSDFSPRRIERYLAQVWQGGAQPVAVLTKADLCDDADAHAASVAAVAPGVPVHTISALHGAGLDAIRGYFAAGCTAALVGSSGVGKSTLVNAIAGTDVQIVRAIREHDDTGVHTTTSRRLFEVPGGGALIDTPGMREFGLSDAEDGLDATFSDVSQLAPNCRFRDCSHETEPGCAVLAAVAAGTLAEDRLESFRHLLRELRFVAAKERKRERRRMG